LEAVKSPKCNKAAGPDELGPEHLIYMVASCFWST